MSDILSPEDGEKAHGESVDLRQTALDHAWAWWKYHADQRIALVRFYIISLGSIAAGVGFLLQQKERFLAAILSLFGAFLSFCFLRLDTRTSDLVKIGEEALAYEHKQLVSATNNEAMNLCTIADNTRKYWPYSYGQIIATVLSVIIAIFILMAVVSLRVSPWLSSRDFP